MHECSVWVCTKTGNHTYTVVSCVWVTYSPKPSKRSCLFLKKHLYLHRLGGIWSPSLSKEWVSVHFIYFFLYSCAAPIRRGWCIDVSFVLSSLEPFHPPIKSACARVRTPRSSAPGERRQRRPPAAESRCVCVNVRSQGVPGTRLLQTFINRAD